MTIEPISQEVYEQMSAGEHHDAGLCQAGFHRSPVPVTHTVVIAAPEHDFVSGFAACEPCARHYERDPRGTTVTVEPIGAQS